MSSFILISKTQMKRKIYLILLFLIFLFLFDRGAALIFRELNFSFYSHTSVKKSVFGKREVIKKNYYDSVIFGTSRTISAIHPLYLYRHLGIKAYNAAKHDRYPEYYYLMYKRFKSSYGKPKFLFYGIDYFIFKARTSKIALMSVLKKKRKVRRINFSRTTNDSSVELGRFSWLFRIKNKIDKTLNDFLVKLSLDWDMYEGIHLNAAGISTYTGMKAVIKPEFRKKPGTWKTFPYSTHENGEGRSLIRLIDELERDGVKVFLVGIPDYIGTYESNVQKDFFINDIRGLIRDRKDIWFLNYNTPDRFDISNPGYFKDGGYGMENSHMSYDGSIPFNKMLAVDVRKCLEQ